LLLCGDFRYREKAAEGDEKNGNADTPLNYSEQY